MRGVNDLLKFARAALSLIAMSLLLVHAAPAAAEQPAELISSFRLKHGEVRVVRDATLDGIALAQARAMAEKDELSHEVLGSFSSRISPSRAGRAAENIAYGYDSFSKTLGQWIDSAEHRKNLLMHGASKVGVASAKSATTGRTYWAMVITSGIERSRPPLPSAKPTKSHHAEQACRLRILGLCL